MGIVMWFLDGILTSVLEAIAYVILNIIMHFLRCKNLHGYCDGYLPAFPQSLFPLFCDVPRLLGFRSCTLPCRDCLGGWLTVKANQWKS